MAIYTCKVCGAVIDGFAAFGQHARAHKRAGEFAPGPRPRVRERGVGRRGPRRIEDVSGAPAGRPVSGSPSVEPEPDSGGRSPAPGAPESLDPNRPSRPTVNAPTIRISPEHTAAGVREAIRDAMPLAMLADLVRTLSIAISEADGAGPAGYLSEIQSTQVASLLYDATVDLVVDRFHGDVTRFKAGMAVVIIVVAKGKVHATAVRDRIRERQARGREAAILRDAEDEPTDPIARAMSLQRATAMGPNVEGLG